MADAHRSTSLTIPASRTLGRAAVAAPVGTALRVDHLGLLRTPRMLLRPLRDADRAEFLRVLAECRGHIEQCTGFSRASESDEAVFDRHLHMTREGDRTGTAWRRVGVAEDGRLAAGFCLATISRGLVFEADATWWVARSACGVGLAGEGVQAMLDYAFAEIPGGLGLHRVNAAIMADNEPSRRLARRAGFVHLKTESLSIQRAGAWVAHELWARSV